MTSPDLKRGERIRPDVRRHSDTWTIKIRGSQRSIKAHVTIGWYGDGKPCEIFCCVSKVGSDLRTAFEAWAMTASKGLQHGLPVEGLAKAIRFIRDDYAGEIVEPWMGAATSLWDAIAQLLEMQSGNEATDKEVADEL